MKNISKKILILCTVVLSAFTVVSFATSPTAFAEDFQTNRDNCEEFLGLTAWDCNVIISDQDSLVTGIWTIAANVAKDIAVIAAYLVLGYVIYGGYLYTMSGGDPNKVATGKKVLTQAFIGLAIAILANIIVGTIRIALDADFTGSCNAIEDTKITECGANPGNMITSLIQWVIGVAGVVSVIFVVYGGISYSTSSGDPNKIKKAKDMILYALIGLAIVALAEVITAFVSGMIRDNSKTSLIQIEEPNENNKIT